jgi:V8-like Glu-specific endopeptidase
VGSEVLVIGHPTGLPTKLADGAVIRSLKETYFIANLDTYGGNSGSAVFDANSGLVEGILVRGEQDYVRSSSGCLASNVCRNDGCRGEDVTYSRYLKEPLKLLEQQ